MLELTVDEYANRTGVSKQAVYKQIKNNQLKTVKRAQNNKIVTVIQINEVVKPNEQNISSQSRDVEMQVNAFADSELLGKVIDDNHKMREELLTLTKDYMNVAQLAGQAKLLMDSEHRTKEEYFRLQQENRQLIEERVELKMKLEQLQEKMSQQEEENKQQGFLGFFSKL